jgi:hypothetical protein
MRDAWKGPVVVKASTQATMHGSAIDCGSGRVVVSNHGGGNWTACPASLRALPEVVDAVNGRIEVLMDGGIRRGADIVKAYLPWRPSRARRPRLRVGTWRRRRPGRCPRHRDSPNRCRSNPSAAWVRIGARARSLFYRAGPGKPSNLTSFRYYLGADLTVGADLRVGADL